MTLDDAYKAYATALGRDADTLNPMECREAILAAVLDGKHIEPASTYCHLLDHELSISRRVLADMRHWLGL